MPSFFSQVVVIFVFTFANTLVFIFWFKTLCSMTMMEIKNINFNFSQVFLGRIFVFWPNKLFELIFNEG